MAVRLGLVVAAMMLAATACGDPAQEPPSTGSTSSAPTVQDATTPPSTGVTPISITFGDTTLRAELWDNPAANALRDRLPLTLEFRDLNREEKVGHLDQPLPMTGMPAGDDPQPQDIGWYAPWGNVVLYYGDVGYWEGIARLGRILDDTQPIADQTADFDVTLELAR